MTCFVVHQKLVRSYACFSAHRCFTDSAPGSTAGLSHSRSIRLSIQPLPKTGRSILSYFYLKMYHILIMYDQISLEYNFTNRLGRTVLIISNVLRMYIFRKGNAFILKYSDHINK